ncbi:MAG TPA: hypothetical protein VLT87_15640, partial [Thermoanaerobaculia bacterium]|nr:hypothetical protein [Thermoanaerobaculia bacterium]
AIRREIELRRRTEMTIQQFAEEMKEQGNRSPLLEALQTLRTFSREQIKDTDPVGWAEWPPVAQLIQDPQT